MIDARRAGATVVGTCSSEAKAAMLRQLGLDRVINYRYVMLTMLTMGICSITR